LRRDHPAHVWAALLYLSAQRGKSYGSLLPYLVSTPSETTAWKHWQQMMTRAARMATFTSEGPRFQHSVLQLLTDGPKTGLHALVAFDNDATPLVIGDPSRPTLTFGQFIRAQSLGTAKSLEEKGQWVMRFGVQEHSGWETEFGRMLAETEATLTRLTASASASTSTNDMRPMPPTPPSVRQMTDTSGSPSDRGAGHAARVADGEAETREGVMTREAAMRAALATHSELTAFRQLVEQLPGLADTDDFLKRVLQVANERYVKALPEPFNAEAAIDALVSELRMMRMLDRPSNPTTNPMLQWPRTAEQLDSFLRRMAHALTAPSDSSSVYLTWLPGGGHLPWKVFEGVYQPEDADDNSGAQHLGQALDMAHRADPTLFVGADVLDMGMGSGPHTGYALLRGARRAVGIDVQQTALDNAWWNLEHWMPELAGRFVGYVGDVWDALPATEQTTTFKIIMLNAPPVYSRLAPRDANIHAGVGGEMIDRFVRGLPQRLAPNGVAFLRIFHGNGFADHGYNKARLEQLITTERLPLAIREELVVGSFTVVTLVPAAAHHEVAPLAPHADGSAGTSEASALAERRQIWEELSQKSGRFLVIGGKWKGAIGAQLKALVAAGQWDEAITLARQHPDQREDRLGWVNVLDRLLAQPQLLEEVEAEARWLWAKRSHVVFIGQGGSILSIPVAQQLWPNPDAPQVHWLDSTDPEAKVALLLALTGAPDLAALKQMTADELRQALARVQFIVITKSGETRETRENLKWVTSLHHRTGLHSKDHVWVLTDPGTSLWREAQAREYYPWASPLARREPLAIQLDRKPDIGGRFSAPGTRVLLLPLALLRPGRLAERLERAQRALMDDVEHPHGYLALGQFLQEHAARGRDKVTCLLPSALQPVGAWGEQLLEESTGKSGKGVMVFPDEGLTLDDLPHLSRDRIFLHVTLRGHADPHAALVEALRRRGDPVWTIALESVDDVLSLQHGLQLALAPVGWEWGINLVDQDAVDGYKRIVESILNDTGEADPLRERLQQVSSAYRITDPTTGVTFVFDGLMALLPDEERRTVQRAKDNGASAAELYAEIVRLMQRRETEVAAERAAASSAAESLPSVEWFDLIYAGKRRAPLRAVLATTRRWLTRTTTWPGKISGIPESLHSTQQYRKDGRNTGFLTLIVHTKHLAPPDLPGVPAAAHDYTLKAQTLATLDDLTQAGRRAVLLIVPGTQDESGWRLEAFLTQVQGRLAPPPVSGPERPNPAAQRVIGESGPVAAEPKTPAPAASGAAAVRSVTDRTKFALESLHDEPLPTVSPVAGGSSAGDLTSGGTLHGKPVGPAEPSPSGTGERPTPILGWHDVNTLITSLEIIVWLSVYPAGEPVPEAPTYETIEAHPAWRVLMEARRQLGEQTESEHVRQVLEGLVRHPVLSTDAAMQAKLVELARAKAPSLLSPLMPKAQFDDGDASVPSKAGTAGELPAAKFIYGAEVNWHLWEPATPGDFTLIRFTANPSIVARRNAAGTYDVFGGGLPAGSHHSPRRPWGAPSGTSAPVDSQVRSRLIDYFTRTRRHPEHWSGRDIQQHIQPIPILPEDKQAVENTLTRFGVSEQDRVNTLMLILHIAQFDDAKFTRVKEILEQVRAGTLAAPAAVVQLKERAAVRDDVARGWVSAVQSAVPSTPPPSGTGPRAPPTAPPAQVFSPSSGPPISGAGLRSPPIALVDLFTALRKTPDRSLTFEALQQHLGSDAATLQRLLVDLEYLLLIDNPGPIVTEATPIRIASSISYPALAYFSPQIEQQLRELDGVTDLGERARKKVEVLQALDQFLGRTQLAEPSEPSPARPPRAGTAQSFDDAHQLREQQARERRTGLLPVFKLVERLATSRGQRGEREVSERELLMAADRAGMAVRSVGRVLGLLVRVGALWTRERQAYGIPPALDNDARRPRVASVLARYAELPPPAMTTWDLEGLKRDISRIRHDRDAPAASPPAPAPTPPAPRPTPPSQPSLTWNVLRERVGRVVTKVGETSEHGPAWDDLRRAVFRHLQWEQTDPTDARAAMVLTNLLNDADLRSYDLTPLRELAERVGLRQQTPPAAGPPQSERTPMPPSSAIETLVEEIEQVAFHFQSESRSGQVKAILTKYQQDQNKADAARALRWLATRPLTLTQVNGWLQRLDETAGPPTEPGSTPPSPSHGPDRPLTLDVLREMFQEASRRVWGRPDWVVIEVTQGEARVFWEPTPGRGSGRGLERDYAHYTWRFNDAAPATVLREILDSHWSDMLSEFQRQLRMAYTARASREQLPPLDTVLGRVPGSLREALRMIATARAHHLQVMVGCMIETSLGITAAAHFTPLLDVVDLDGAALLRHDPFSGAGIPGGKVTLPTAPGLGVVRR